MVDIIILDCGAGYRIGWFEGELSDPIVSGRHVVKIQVRSCNRVSRIIIWVCELVSNTEAHTQVTTSPSDAGLIARHVLSSQLVPSCPRALSLMHRNHNTPILPRSM